MSLAGDEVTSWQHLSGQQPNMTGDEWHECNDMLRAHPDVIAALGRRGITDLSLVLADMGAYGAAFVPERYAGRRLGPRLQRGARMPSLVHVWPARPG